MIWLNNWKHILLHDRALIWPYLKINVRRVIYWGSISPVFIILATLGLIALIFRGFGAFINAIFEMLGEGMNWVLRKTRWVDFEKRTDKCYEGLAKFSYARKLARLRDE